MPRPSLGAALALLPLLVGAPVGTGCAGEETTGPPSDDPSDYDVDTEVSYLPVLSTVRWVVPSSGLPGSVKVKAANNNTDIVFFGDRLFLAWRTAETHFASDDVVMVVVSSLDQGITWELEHTIKMNADLREPRFLSFGGQLMLHFFEAGTNPLAFEPRYMWRTSRSGPGSWTAATRLGKKGEVPWNIKVRGGLVYMTSYEGPHYQSGPGQVDVFFKVSSDGLTWASVDPARPVVYHGGVSEVAFELDESGSLWAVTRNEDGDQSGFGSHLCRAAGGRLAQWSCPSKSDPERYDSPQMLRHGKDLYLLARRDIGGPYDQGRTDLSFDQRKTKYLLDYSMRPKRTALYRIDRTARKVVHVQDLPSAGDTAFPAVRRSGTHTFLVANYTSPLDDPDRTWLKGQMSSDGTKIYFLTLTFVPR